MTSISTDVCIGAGSGMAGVGGKRTGGFRTDCFRFRPSPARTCMTQALDRKSERSQRGERVDGQLKPEEHRLLIAVRLDVMSRGGDARPQTAAQAPNQKSGNTKQGKGLDKCAHMQTSTVLGKLCQCPLAGRRIRTAMSASGRKRNVRNEEESGHSAALVTTGRAVSPNEGRT